MPQSSAPWRTLGFVVMLAAVILSPKPAAASDPLNFQDRVAAQEAVERVFYAHRIWPAENPDPRPPFETAVPRGVLDARVTDYLKKSEALERMWQRPVMAEQLQAEILRMARGTRDSEMLSELFAVLHNDPSLIAECLARPILVDRLIHEAYASEARLHAGTRSAAERALLNPVSGFTTSGAEGEGRRITLRLADEAAERTDQGALTLERDAFNRERAQSPMPGLPMLRETAEAFIVERTVVLTSDTLVREDRVFAKRPFDAWWSEVAPGIAASEPSGGASFHLPTVEPSASDGRSTDAWTAVSATGVPDGRYHHSAVWTGAEMIVWGGYNGAYLNSGGRYAPATDSWTATSTGTGCPSIRAEHTAVWTGSLMILWGGYDGTSYLNTGARYNPSSDTWVATGTGTNCPSGRSQHTAVWTGTLMIVWGGYDGTNYLNTGARYSPSTFAWTATSTGTNCPTGRSYHTAVANGTSRMIVWGGWDGTSPVGTGGKYVSSSDTWTATSTGTNCPAARYHHTAVWTGSMMIVWGGYGSAYLKNGGRYVPSSDVWAAVSTTGDCPSKRAAHAAVWDGAEMVVWGGQDSTGPLGTGGLYTPGANSWAATSAGTDCPSARVVPTAVWTGTEMIIWGGVSGSSYLNTGSRYTPLCTAPSAPVITAVADTDPCAQSGVTIAFTSGSPASRHDLYVDGALAASGIASPYTFVPGDTASHAYVVRAVNGGNACFTDSDPQNGTDADSMPGQPVITSIVDVDPLIQDGIQVYYTPGVGATSHDLYKDGGLAVAGYGSGALYNPGDTATHGYVVQAVVSGPGCTNASAPMNGTDLGASTPPEEAPGTSASNAQAWSPDKSAMSWPSDATANGYKVYRGVLSGLPALLNSGNDSCLRYSGTSTSVDLSADDPATDPGGFYWYLVVAYNGAGDGSAGSATAGARIVNSSGSCP